MPSHLSPTAASHAPAFLPTSRGLNPRIATLVAGLALAGASVHAQVTPASTNASPQPREAAGSGRGADAARQSAHAANQQADAAFQRADRDGDGRLSRAEADHLPAIAARFEQLDANRDQYISRAEFNRVLAD